MKHKKKGLLLHADDLEVGRLCTVYQGPPYMTGLALKITAINLPFIVVTPYDPTKPAPITLDIRTTPLMAVTKDFAEAQLDRYPDLQPGHSTPSEGGSNHDDDRKTRQVDR